MYKMYISVCKYKILLALIDADSVIFDRLQTVNNTKSNSAVTRILICRIICDDSATGLSPESY